jgi:hypothetical protein
MIRRVLRYQRGIQNPYIEEGQTTQWRKEKVQKDKQRSTKHTHITNDLVARTHMPRKGKFEDTKGVIRTRLDVSWIEKVTFLIIYDAASFYETTVLSWIGILLDYYIRRRFTQTYYPKLSSCNLSWVIIRYLLYKISGFVIRVSQHII